MKHLNILTGTPGTGKTTLINEFAERGIQTVEEPARPILTHQLKIDGPDLPSKSPLRFVQAMLRKMEEDFERSASLKGPILFDRGIPDLIAYAIRFFVESTEFEEAAKRLRYNPRVFILPPWEEIFVHDQLRRLPFEEGVKFHDELVKAYERLGYDLVEVPKVSVDERMEFVSKKIGL